MTNKKIILVIITIITMTLTGIAQDTDDKLNQDEINQIDTTKITVKNDAINLDNIHGKWQLWTTKSFQTWEQHPDGNYFLNTYTTLLTDDTTQTLDCITDNQLTDLQCFDLYTKTKWETQTNTITKLIQKSQEEKQTGKEKLLSEELKYYYKNGDKP